MRTVQFGISLVPNIADMSQLRTPGEASQALEEGIAIMRTIWNAQGNLRYDGKSYTQESQWAQR